MGVSHISIGNTSTYADSANGEIVIIDVISDLLRTSECIEIANGVTKYVKAFGGDSGGDARHVLFGHSDIDKVVGMLLAKFLNNRIA